VLTRLPGCPRCGFATLHLLQQTRELTIYGCSACNATVATS
jgi:hypothetical protein